MRFASLPRLALVLSTAAPASCGAPELPAPDLALRSAFPAHAAAVLDRGAALVATADGFAPTAGGAPRGFAVELPRAGEGVIRLRLPDGLEVRVREVGAAGEGVALDRAVAYRRAGGTSFWTAAPGGVEHWLHLGGGAPGAGAAAAWEIEGAALLLRGAAVAVTDDAGRARLWVTAPRAYARGGRPVAARLAVRGARIELFVDGAQDGEPVLVDPAWTTAAPMLQERSFHTATQLADGTVLAVGGEDSAAAILSGAERYDPVGNFWSGVGGLASPREYHSATLLPDGRVLVAGGRAAGGALASAELFDPVTSTFSAASSMAVARVQHTATRLGTGEVLIAGGSTSAPNPGAELYDPVAGSFTPAGPPVAARAHHTATLLSTGEVLLAGGYDPGTLVTLDTAERYDPVADTFTATGALLTGRVSHAAALLSTGEVLVVGGGKPGTAALAAAERYDAQTGAWSAASSLVTARLAPTATSLPGGAVLVAGGADLASNPLASAELYDAAGDTWQPVPAMWVPHLGHAATGLGNGAVLISGGNQEHAEIFTLAPAAPGAGCIAPGDCASGFCVDGVCCNVACGVCHACAVIQGAVADGVCTAVSGPPCDDGNPCTQVDFCNVGVCQGSDPIACPPQDTCHLAGVCAPATGECSHPAKPDGASCQDGDPCTTADTCHAGVCQAGAPVVCSGEDACSGAGVCDPASSVCVRPPKPDGTPCDDGSACTQMDTCHAGVCGGVSTVVCTPLDACHENGACDPATGQCSNPERPDGATCPGGACSAGVCGPAPDAGADGGAGGGSTGGGGSSAGCSCLVSRPAEAGGGVGGVCPLAGGGAAEGAPARESPPALTAGGLSARRRKVT
jgi:hypothetical protein